MLPGLIAGAVTLIFFKDYSFLRTRVEVISESIDIFAKGASFLGSLVIASVKLAGGTINVAVATMAIFFAVGFVFLRLADRYDAPRHENN